MSANPFADVVAIDGPSASGKTTVARKVADRLGSTVFDTGALYRAVTLESIRQGIAPSDGQALEHLSRTMSIDLTETGQVLVNGEDVSARVAHSRSRPLGVRGFRPSRGAYGASAGAARNCQWPQSRHGRS